MLRKRIIFTLLYSNGSFALSRNFRLQFVGDLRWLEQNYCFSKVSQFIDELVILDVTRKERNLECFKEVVSHISSSCFVPIAVGGGIDSVDKARELMNAGADKVVVNSCLFDNGLIDDLANSLGRQSIVGSIDVANSSRDAINILVRNGEVSISIPTENFCSKVNCLPLGEVYINSVLNDGTGNGLDFRLVEMVGDRLDVPIILAGGIGNKNHVVEGLACKYVNAVSTAHLFNFIGDGLMLSRQHAIESGISLAQWPSYELIKR